MQFYLSGSRLGTLLHAILYLIGVPIFMDMDETGLENSGNSSIINDFVFNSSFFEFHIESNTTNVSADRERCYGHLGCIKMRYPERRGFYLFPDPIEDIGPTICHYTHKNENKCQIVDSETIDRLLVAPGNNSYWITHGYMENGNRPWIKEMVHELLEFDKTSNVIVLDWSQGARPPYNQAVVNAELIAAYTGHIMALLEEVHGVLTCKAHIIGHSLGSHLGGFIGSWLQENLKLRLLRITGLDPAQPYFQDYPEDARLDPSDADFVDVIHTDARPMMDGGEWSQFQSSVSGLGTEQPSGHADYWPNNGKDQPGCKEGVYQAILQEDGSFLYGIRRFLGCDHMRAYEYFTESIRSPCLFKGFSCPSWEHFSSLSCNLSHNNRMGFHAKNPYLERKNDGNSTQFDSIKYYLLTSSKAPYCRDHFVITIKLMNESTYRSNSDLHLVLSNDKGSTSILTLDSTELRGTNLTFKYLRDGVFDGPITKVILRPAMSNPVWWFVNRMGPKTPDITVDYISVLHLEKDEQEIKFCPDGSPSFSVSDQNPSVSLLTGDDCV